MTLSGPIVFILFGYIAGPKVLGVIQVEVESETLQMLAELTLALVLYIDAAHADLNAIRSNLRIPQRLLLGGLPLTILFGFGVAWFIFPEFSIIEAALLATMLAPTDAALGKEVISNKNVPVSIREGLKFESGFNDGLCVPVIFLFLTIATKTSKGMEDSVMLAIQLITREVGIGIILGVGITWLAFLIGKKCAKFGWVTETWEQVIVISLALTCYFTAQACGGSGFIASFSGGILFGALVTDEKHELLKASEGIGDSMALATWVLFGAGVIGQVLDVLTWQIVVYSVLSLTVIRMLPVWISLAGSGMRNDRKLFLAWFGPRGLASIVFGVIVLLRELPNEETMSLTVVMTVVLSILAHGFTANPMSKRVGKVRLSESRAMATE